MIRLGTECRSGLGPKLKFSELASFAVILGLLIACCYSFATDTTCKGMICRGDFPAFYSAAKLAYSNDTYTDSDIYNNQRQQDIQNQYWPSLEGQYLYFSYPPYVASILSPISLLGPKTAKILFLFSSICCLFLALYLLSKETRQSFFSLISITLCFFPSMVGLVSGQNFTLSFLLLTIIYLALTKYNNDYLVGVAVGCWIFKPHFALIAYIGLFCCRRTKAVIVSTFIFLITYILTSYKYGFLWPLKWLKVVKYFYQEDLINNSYQMISIISYFESMGLALLGVTLSLSLFFIYCYVCYRNGRKAYLNTLPAIVILCSPHTMYYDLGLLLIPFFMKTIVISTRMTIVVLTFTSSIFLLRECFYLSPLIILPFLSFLYVEQERAEKF